MAQKGTVFVFPKVPEGTGHRQEGRRKRQVGLNIGGTVTTSVPSSLLLDDGRVVVTGDITKLGSPNQSTGWKDWNLFFYPKGIVPGLATKAYEVQVYLEHRAIRYFRTTAGACIASFTTLKTHQENPMTALKERLAKQGIVVKELEFRSDRWGLDHVFIDSRSRAYLSPGELADRIRQCDDQVIRDTLTRLTKRESLEQLADDLDRASDPNLSTSYHGRQNVKSAYGKKGQKKSTTF
jgi:tetrahydromethanopterin S-methyltransferase subunit B